MKDMQKSSIGRWKNVVQREAAKKLWKVALHSGSMLLIACIRRWLALFRIAAFKNHMMILRVLLILEGNYEAEVCLSD